MIKIIEENWFVLLGICPYCLSKFTLEYDDLMYLHTHSDIKGVQCPVCTNDVTTCDIKKVPEREIKELKDSDVK